MNEITISDRVDAVKGKRIHVFENGNSDSFGRELLINCTRERTWNKVLTYLTQVLEPSYGIVRRLISVDGKESVHSFSELDTGARYVACGKEQFKKISGGYRTLTEYNHSKKKKCAKLYPKLEKNKEDITKDFWALTQAQKNKRTVIYVFLNGRKHHAPVKFVLIDNDFRNWPRTLSHIANKLDKPEGIRYLYTIYGRRVCGPCEIQHGACYVATAFGENFQKLNYIDSYEDLILYKKKSGETIRQFNIGAVSSPMGFEIRNDDCFLTKHKGEDKKRIHKAKEQEKGRFTKKRKEKKRSNSISTNTLLEKGPFKKSTQSSLYKKAMSVQTKGESENTSIEKRSLKEGTQISLSKETMTVQSKDESENTSLEKRSLKEGTQISLSKETMTVPSKDESENTSLGKRSSKKSTQSSLSEETMSIQTKDESENTIDIYQSNKIEDEKEGKLQEERLSTILEVSQPFQDTDKINEVTVEAVGIKIVTDRQISTSSKITQTAVENRLKQNSRLFVNSTPECGIRIIGADEISRRKFSNVSVKSLLSPEEEAKIINEHNRKIKETLSKLSSNTDSEFIKSRESAVSFTYCYVNGGQVIKDLKLTAIDDNSKIENQRTIAAPPVNNEDIASITESKSVAIIENPEIIPNSIDYSTDDIGTITKRLPLIQRRSTGFNINFGSILSPGDSDGEDDDNKSENYSSMEKFPAAKQITKGTTDYIKTTTDSSQSSSELTNVIDIPVSKAVIENGEQCELPLVESQLVAIVDCSDLSTQVLEQLREDKSVQGGVKDRPFNTCNDAASQKTEFKDQNILIDLPKKTKSIKTTTGTDASTQESERLKEKNEVQSILKDKDTTIVEQDGRTKYTTTYQDTYNQTSHQLNEAETQKSLPAEAKVERCANITVERTDASNQKPEQLRNEKTQMDLPKEIKATETISTSTTIKDKAPEKQEQVTQISKIRTRESGTTEGKRAAIASEIEQLLQKGDKTILHPKLCNKLNDTSPVAVQNMQSKSEFHQFKSAHEKGIIKDVYCLCNFPFDTISEHVIANDDTEINQNCFHIIQEVQPSWSVSNDTICSCNYEMISKETQTEDHHFVSNPVERKLSTMKYYITRSATYNEFLEMPYETSEIEVAREYLRPKTKKKFPFCKCFNFCK